MYSRESVRPRIKPWRTKDSLLLNYPIHISMSISIPTYLPTYLPTCLPACLPACLPIYKIFLHWNTAFFSSESSVCLIFWILPKLYWTLWILSQKFTGNVLIKDLWALENDVFVNMLLCSSHFTDAH